MNETTQPKTKGLFKRMSHKIQKTLRISKPKYRKSIDLDDLISEQICVDDDHTMNNLANSIKILDNSVSEVEDEVIDEDVIDPPAINKMVRSMKMPNLCIEDQTCNDARDKDDDSTDDSTDDACLTEVCLQDEDDECDHEVCFREVTILNISGANGKKPTYKITNTCRCPRLRLC
jgi:hypothetical protein